MSKKFIKGLKLNKGYYYDIVKPLIESHYPQLNYSAGLIGYGSDVLGFDTAVSMDHNWGPRLILFLLSKDIREYEQKLDNLFRQELPFEYKGFPTNFTEPDLIGVQRMKKITSGEVNHLIEIMSIENFLDRYLDIKSIDNLELMDWLKFSEQGLIEVTKGGVFHDGLNQLRKIREYFNFYPKDILKLKLAALWNYIAQEEAFIGRNVDLEESLGVKLISSRIVNALMKICFYLENEYPPYSKWFAKSFSRLDCYEQVGKLFTEIINSEDLNEIEELICRAYQKVVSLQNELELTAEINLNVKSYYGRPYKVVFADKIAEQLIASIEDDKLKKINLDYIALLQNLGKTVKNPRYFNAEMNLL